MGSLSQIRDLYLDHLRVERNYSPHTLEAYARDLDSFIVLLGIQQVTHIVQIRSEHVSEWLREMVDNGLQASSQSRALSAVRQWLLFAEREGWIKNQPVGQIFSPRQPRRLPFVPSQAQIKRLLSLPDQKSTIGIRDQAVLELLYGAGLRASELCDLQIGDINLRLGVIRVRGKGRKERLVPLGQTVCQCLTQYIEQARAVLNNTLNKSCNQLFFGKNGVFLTRTALYDMVRHYATEAGILEPLSPHSLRHAFATHLLRGGADLRSVQEMLGHEDISTTELYTQIEIEGLQRSVQQHHPLGGVLTRSPLEHKSR